LGSSKYFLLKLQTATNSKPISKLILAKKCEKTVGTDLKSALCALSHFSFQTHPHKQSEINKGITTTRDRNLYLSEKEKTKFKKPFASLTTFRYNEINKAKVRCMTDGKIMISHFYF
jgi:hypothetical protein